MKAYQVPRTMCTPHGSKYSLVYIYNGHRLLGYDNHEHQGDHRHYRTFTSPIHLYIWVDRLVDDFLSDMKAVKKEIS